MTWGQLSERDCREWKLWAIDPHDRNTWRSGVRSAMCAASRLQEGGPLMWILLLYLHINKKSDDDDLLLSTSIYSTVPCRIHSLCKTRRPRDVTKPWILVSFS